MNRYQLRGPVPTYSVAYVTREFEPRILEAVHLDRWVLLLGPRQHGKTTSLIRVQTQLRTAGYLCTTLDLQSLPPKLNYEQLLEWVAVETSRSLGVQSFEKPSGIYAGDIKPWIEAIIPDGTGKVVIIIDEASAIRERSILETFYGQLRSLLNRRADAVAGTMERRMIFVFAGTFLPEKLIKDSDNSPFNICEPVETDDFSLRQIMELQSKVDGIDDIALCEEIYRIVGGQPYLVQKCLDISQQLQASGKSYRDVSIKEKLLTGMDGHFEALFREIRSSDSLGRIVRNMVDDNSVRMQPTNTDHRYLVVCGLAKNNNGLLQFRSSLYSEMAKDACGQSATR